MFRLASDSKRVHNTDPGPDSGKEAAERRSKRAQERMREAMSYLPIEDDEMPA